jgi:hypothetical protein
MKLRIKPGRPWIWVAAAILILALSGLAIQQSVTVRASWKVLPYQTLRLGDAGDEAASVAFEIPEPTPLDYARGFIEAQHAVQLHVVSNTSWKIQVQLKDAQAGTSAGIQLRSHSGEYLILSVSPQIIAQGSNGVFEISIDYRLLLDSEGPFTPGAPREIIYTIMSN